MKRKLIAAVAAAGSRRAGAAGAGRRLVEEWASVKVPSAPALKSVTVDPKTTALLMLDFMTELRNGRAAWRFRLEEAARRRARRLGDGGLFSIIAYELAVVITDGAPRQASHMCCRLRTNSCTPIGEDLKDKFIKTLIVVGTCRTAAVLFAAIGAAFAA